MVIIIIIIITIIIIVFIIIIFHHHHHHHHRDQGCPALRNYFAANPHFAFQFAALRPQRDDPVGIGPGVHIVEGSREAEVAELHDAVLRKEDVGGLPDSSKDRKTVKLGPWCTPMEHAASVFELQATQSLQVITNPWRDSITWVAGIHATRSWQTASGCTGDPRHHGRYQTLLTNTMTRLVLLLFVLTINIINVVVFIIVTLIINICKC